MRIRGEGFQAVVQSVAVCVGCVPRGSSWGSLQDVGRGEGVIVAGRNAGQREFRSKMEALAQILKEEADVPSRLIGPGPRMSAFSVKSA